jgi:hypothetical protein
MQLPLHPLDLKLAVLDTEVQEGVTEATPGPRDGGYAESCELPSQVQDVLLGVIGLLTLKTS